jgi:uncharacterized protein
METIICKNPGDFLNAAQDWLEKREVENSLILGVTARLDKFVQRFKSQPFLAVVKRAEEIVAAAMITPPYNLVLSGDPQPDALYSLANHLIDNGWSPPGVSGPKATSQAFVKIWAELTGAKIEPGMAQRIYKLTEAKLPAGVPGILREAAPEEIELVAGWAQAFQLEALGSPMDGEEALELARWRVDERDIFLWDIGEVVSMAAKGRPTRSAIAVSLVYTPPDHRRKGYAGACVAALSQKLLDEGYRSVSLYTDLGNPTSNHIYMNIGFRPVCDFNEYRFG